MYRNFSLMLIAVLYFGGLKAQNLPGNKANTLQSKWAAEVNISNPLPEYPRPQMKRKAWNNLNGLWDYTITSEGSNVPESYEQKILVPFAIESALSGVQKRISEKEVLWYRRSFTLPENWNDKRILLHFGAVDWEATVYVNGKKLGTHQGGFDPFSFDITDALTTSGPQELIVSVWDPTSNGTQPRGKQVTDPKGIWYTPVTGIWQTVWLEPVPRQSITSLRLTPDIDKEQLAVIVNGSGSFPEGYEVTLTAFDGKRKVATAKGDLGQTITMAIKKSKLWSPGDPFLYDLKVALTSNGKNVDEVDSYFGMRKISTQKDANGYVRLMLNNKYLFQYGTLDQGWWPDGLYTAPSDEGLKYDIEITKKSGFNMIRKHVKVEPARWYYHCDKLGMLVWQDMPSGDKSADWRGPSGYDGREMQRTAQSAHQFYREWKAVMDANYNKPSIVMWVPFNEAWGQFNTVEVINWTMNYDPSRLVNGPSGGNYFPVGHTVDWHQYPGPGMPDANNHAPAILKDRVLVLGEFGGLGLPVKDHLWQKDKNWGYRNLIDRDELVRNYEALINKIPELIKRGLSAAIYTQTTDVEGEVNGLMTYDRGVIKMDEKRMNEINAPLYDVVIENR
ncbi:glycoside hydrolase family 2 TIM barrel-domain containing protein [Fulvivirgaceae bacterium BMA12]|uniref:Glycoside hydrolase family 2 TIM barrel-domain containing protein n=1 Tax=Agaribacillus aureus TaxID=3051825 RepID=A0ABT8LBJ6_9BACT|nr:glycoside hydrolase family 2 TIM barrel-domain containing protein [Fulvivirgaceae bacterium BMA12]